jgi:hypothetical protein
MGSGQRIVHWDSIPMRSLSDTQFWFVVAAVALTPMLTFWIAGLIGWFLRHTLWRRSGVEPQSGREPPREEPVGLLIPPL